MTSEAETLLNRAKMAEQAERYDDMKNNMKTVVEKKKTLTDEERNLLSVAYKNVVGSRRSAWRIISVMEAKETNPNKQKTAEEYRIKIEDELNKICDEVIKLLEEYLISSDDKPESKVFYQKMKGDYFRYKVEVANDKDREIPIAKSKEAYEQASSLAEGMPSVNAIRLGLALNYSVFYYEIMNEPPKACELAKQAFDAAMSEMDSVGDFEQKDSMLIMQLLRDNLTLWSDNPDDQDEQQQEN